MEKVSLIMTTYNCKEHFRRSFESVLLQDYPDIEIVIVDGGSTDGTKELIEEAASIVNKEENGRFSVKFISEPDKGIYDGMNKGIKMSTGDVIAVLNDRFSCNSAVSEMINELNRSGMEGVHADLKYVDEYGKTVRDWHMGQGNIRSGWMPAHPTLYLKRSVYEEYGLYDIKYRSSADYEFIVRILKDGKVRLAYIPKVMILMYYGGTSNGGLKGYVANAAEAYRALYENHVMFPGFIIIKRVIMTLMQFRGYST